MRNRSSLAKTVTTLIFGMLMSCPGQALADVTAACKETPGPTPQRNLSLRELQASTTKPTLTVAVKGRSERNGDVRLTVKDGKSVGTTPRAASAEIIEKPMANNEELDATLSVAAAPTQRGRSVTVYLCATDVARQAGKFEGIVEVSGTRFKEFQYAVVVTQRYPLWIPVVILAVFFILVVVTELFRDATKIWSALPAAVVAGLFLVGTYYGQYHYNDTWGDNFFEQVIALITAATGAIAAARATATRLAAK